MTADAVVIGTHSDGRVDVEFAPAINCAACAGTCLWKRLRQGRLNGLPASAALLPGTEVTVALSDRRVVLMSLWLHGLPLAVMLAGAAVGYAVSGTDLGTLAGVTVALGVLLPAFGLWRSRLEQAMLAGLVVEPR